MTVNSKESPEFKVTPISCAICGASIESSGNCPSCGQLMIITRDRQLLSIPDKDIEGINISPPKPQRGSDWQIGSCTYTDDQMTVLGNGLPVHGARMAAFYYAKHPGETLPGMRKAEIKKIEMFILASALKASKSQ